MTRTRKKRSGEKLRQDTARVSTARAANLGRMGKIYCDGKGSHEGDPFSFAGDAKEAPAACPKCVAAPQYLFGIRIDDMENVGADRTDPRTKDVNLGLGGTFIPVGPGPDGKMKYDYRPCTNRDASSNRRAKEIGKRQGLTMIEERYRSR